MEDESINIEAVPGDTILALAPTPALCATPISIHLGEAVCRRWRGSVLRSKLEMRKVGLQDGIPAGATSAVMWQT